MNLNQMQQHYTQVSQHHDQDCGCPVEEWVIGNLNVEMHLDPSGHGDIFIDCGEWQEDKQVPANTMEELRAMAVQWVESIPVSDEL